MRNSELPFGRELDPAFRIPHSELVARSWTEAEAFAYCTKLTLGHYENFPVGSLLMPKAIQPAIHSLYAFMRTADDFSDEDRKAGDEAERLAWLKAWGAMLDETLSGTPTHPVFIALRVTLRQHELPVQWLKDLLHAFEMDVTIRRYKTYDDVLNYCRYSANPVGRLILTLSGYRDDAFYALSDHICTALQLANHWQDVAIDLKKDRIYLPQDDLSRFGLTDNDLAQGPDVPGFRALLSYEVERARQLFMQGRPLPMCVTGRLRWELKFTWLGGMRILEKIEAAHFDVFANRPVVTAWDWALLAGRTVFW